MKIGIDISQTAFEGTGVARFTDGLISAILEYDKKNIWTFFYSSLRKQIHPVTERKIQSSRHKLIITPIPPSILSIIWNSFHIIQIEYITGKLDWFISSDWTEPPANCKKATIIHDLAFIRYPETIHPTILQNQKKRMQFVVKESSSIFTDSDTTKKDVLAQYPLDFNKVHLNYPGVTIQNPTQTDIKRTTTKFHLHKPFILSVSKREPRKNVDRLIQAFLQSNLKQYELLLVGPKGWGKNQAHQKTNLVRYLGYVSEAELHSLYQLSSFFVYPSLWEGFGYPVVEAMLHKKAVLTSSHSSLQELVGSSGVLCDSFSIQSITSGIVTLAQNEKIRKEYEERGYLKAQQFTWKQYYKNMMKYIQ